jgi:hypothetical protein
LWLVRLPCRSSSFSSSPSQTIYVAIAILVFFGENRFSYMLGIIVPAVWFIADILVGIFLRDFRVLLDYVSGHGTAPLETPLHGIARLMAILLFIGSFRAWKREVPERFIAKTFWICGGVSLTYAVVLALWHLYIVRAAS